MFMEIVPVKAIRLYVLLPSLMKAPEWLRKDFQKLKIGGVDARIPVDWNFNFAIRLMYVVSQQLQEMETSYLEIWESKGIQPPKVTIKLGRPEGSSLTDHGYIIAVREADAEEPQCSTPVVEIQSKGAQGTIAEKTSRLIAAVRKNDITEVKHLLLDVRPPVLASYDEENIETLAGVAMRSRDMDMLTLLIRHGMEVTEPCLMYLISQILQKRGEQVKGVQGQSHSQYMDQLEGMLLMYVTCTRNPISCLAVISQVLKEEAERHVIKQEIQVRSNLRFEPLIIQTQIPTLNMKPARPTIHTTHTWYLSTLSSCIRNLLRLAWHVIKLGVR